jgi:hypothetical protein
VSFREGRAEAPVLYEDDHIESIFKVLDPSDTGTVTMYQYRTGDEELLILNLEVPTV